MTIHFPVILTILLTVLVVAHERRKIVSPSHRRTARLSAASIWVLSLVIVAYLLQRIAELS